MGNTFNPMQVMMKQSEGAPSSQAYLTPNSIRASGQGPFDSSYRQNLATYAGGQFQPSGQNNVTSFNPTNIGNTFGNPVGGGNAPVNGMPTTLLGSAMGQAPGAGIPGAAAQNSQGNFGNLQSWLEQFMGGYQLPGASTNG